MRALDLFSAAAGGWSLGMHRAGYRTIAACEVIPWRRALYSQNNPGVPIYDDVTTITAARLVRDLGYLPDIIVGSPPCQDISSANTTGKGVDGDRSKLYFEAIRIIGECQPDWFALENSANLRTRGADRVLDALEAVGYTCWPFVVSAGDVGANHERKRSWLIGCNVRQVADTARLRHGGGWAWGYRQNGDGSASVERGNASDSNGARRAPFREGISGDAGQECAPAQRAIAGWPDVSHTNGEGQPDRTEYAEMGRGTSACGDAAGPWSDWNRGLAGHLRVDDGLSAWLAGARVAVGGPRGTSAASLVVEAFGDAVLPQIPEAIGRAIMRVEAALSALTAANDNTSHRRSAMMEPDDTKYCACPFCGDTDFDLIGLKLHLVCGHCDPFNETPDCDTHPLGANDNTSLQATA